jgi:hypothetical protein
VRGTSREELIVVGRSAVSFLCQERSMSSEKKVGSCHGTSSPDSGVMFAKKKPLALIARLAAMALLGGAFTVSCAPPIDRGDPDGGEDRGDLDLSGIQPQPSTGVCNGGKQHCYAQIRTDGVGHIKAFANTSGIGPADIKSAYKLDTSKGSGATIAIIDAFNYPNAESDLATYRSNYGLPACTKANGCFKVVNQNGAASPLPANSPAGDDWSVEAALDLDTASAACPNCKLILIEANDDQSDGLYIANDTAAAMGATVASNSWGGPDDGSSGSLETHFNHPATGYFVASGDSGNTGSTPDYPSTSAFVTGVGGTSLVKSSNARGWTEGAWSGAGSSCSKTIAKPGYQTNNVCAKRAASDVSAVADPNTGLAVYNKANGGWIVVGGTSAACPIVAAIYALTGHGKDGPSYAYSHATGYFDVTTGKNGSCGNVLCNAGAGWDGPTGIGSPNGSVLGGGGTCTPSCTGKACGSDGCGGTCGTCGANQTCTASGQCQDNGCTPNCAGKTCGDDGCGGSCGSCSGGATCSNGTCTGGGGTCAHPICSTGGSLASSCDSCAASICAVDSYCCTTGWDSICVGEVGSVCGQSCSGGGSTCTHDECSTGTKLKSGCDACVTKICNSDSYCCKTKWDSQCVGEVGSICAESCN